MRIKKPEFNVGDRVTMKEEHRGMRSTCHGEVIYCNGEHYPRYPRVRWDSGWSTTVDAVQLRPLKLEEIMMWPRVKLHEFDTQPGKPK